MAGIGTRSKFSFPYVGDRPREILGLTEAQEATISQFIGFAGTDPDDQPVEQFILTTLETSVTLSNYPTVPIGTIILTPKVSGVALYQRIARATQTASIDADWNKVVKASV